MRPGVRRAEGRTGAALGSDRERRRLLRRAHRRDATTSRRRRSSTRRSSIRPSTSSWSTRGSGRALELGIGTGRIALPLARRGVPVHGIELSNAMAAKLRAKPGAEDVGVTIGDFATTTVEGSFSLAYLVYNTIMNLHDAGGAGRVLPQRGGASRTGRALRHRGHDPGATAAPARRDLPRLRRPRGRLGHRRVRRREPGPRVAPPGGRRTGTSRRSRSRSATSGPPSSTSWRSSPG